MLLNETLQPYFRVRQRHNPRLRDTGGGLCVWLRWPCVRSVFVRRRPPDRAGCVALRASDMNIQTLEENCGAAPFKATLEFDILH